MDISVVICCHNSVRRLAPTLKALIHADLAHVREVIVVDNASTDGTGDFAKKLLTNCSVDYSVVIEERAGLAYARAKGVAMSSGEIISFLDDDNEIQANWFGQVAYHFATREKLGGCGGATCAPVAYELPKWFDSVSSNYAVGRQALSSSDVTNDRMLLWGAGLSVKADLARSFYNDIDNIKLVGRKGDQLLAGDDTELCYSIILSGYRLYYDDEMVLIHNFDSSRLTLTHLLKVNVGFGRARYCLRPYHKALGKGRVHKLPSIMQAEKLAPVLAILDLFAAVVSTMLSPSVKSLTRLANAHGYLLQMFNR